MDSGASHALDLEAGPETVEWGLTTEDTGGEIIRYCRTRCARDQTLAKLLVCTRTPSVT